MPVSTYGCCCPCINSSPPSLLICLPHNACQCNICAPIPPSALLQKLMFFWLFESFLQVQLYAGANVMMLAFCSYRSACLEMPASATSVHWYLPQFCPKSYVFCGCFETFLVMLSYAGVHIWMLLPTHQFWPPVTTCLPASQCLPVQHPFTDDISPFLPQNFCFYSCLKAF